jgi:hypothetical protein
MSGAPAFLKHSRINALSIIPYTQAQQAIVVTDFGFDPACPCMPECVS